MADTCTHLDTVTDVTPTSSGCEDCERIGGHGLPVSDSTALTAPQPARLIR